MSALDAVYRAEERARLLKETIYVVAYGTAYRAMTKSEVLSLKCQDHVLEAVHP